MQRCIVQQFHSSARYVSYKDVKAFTVALKPIYKTPTEESALEALGELERIWGTKTGSPSAPGGITGMSFRPCSSIRSRYGG
ncbi:hypothetical protein HCH52_11780 [Oscillospiraceae bacterium HV4-5-C5C]|nr:hypothetical protein [Oscillospiraceae bacterium HV4-5-C5C]